MMFSAARIAITLIMMTSILWGTPGVAKESLATAELNDATNSLASAPYFSHGNNGFIGQRNDAQKALEIISSSPDAIDRLINIALAAPTTPAGSLYAACGLQQKHYNSMNIIFPPLFHYTVSVLEGDILRKESFYDVYTRISTYGCQ
ncbi:hypothetical protein ACMYSK_06590 [Klebsiella sp. I138]|uniref:hypothetical protein n=1 Tax=Klebsiella sp. I138 TaxID=2755385 RepID=UPI003DA93D7E